MEVKIEVPETRSGSRKKRTSVRTWRLCDEEGCEEEEVECGGSWRKNIRGVE